MGGNVGRDLVALLSMVGALALSQPLAGAVVALMYAAANRWKPMPPAVARRMRPAPLTLRWIKVSR